MCESIKGPEFNKTTLVFNSHIVKVFQGYEIIRSLRKVGTSVTERWAGCRARVRGRSYNEPKLDGEDVN